MAKGDSNRAQNTIDTQGQIGQTNLENLKANNTGMTTNFQQNYGTVVPENLNNYNDVMSSYKSFLQGMPNAGQLYGKFLGGNYSGATQTGPASATASTSASDHPVDQLFAKYGAKDTGPGSGVTDAAYWKQKYDSTQDPYYLGRLEDDLKGNGMDAYSGSSSSSSTMGPGIAKALEGYGNFADTGGFTPADISNIRARSIAPIRSMADTNRQEIQRQAALRGTGYSPNTAAAIAKTARDSNYAAGDTATNAEAMIAQLMQQGKLYGLQGLSGTGLANQSNTTANRGLDLSAINAATGNQLQGMQGQTQLYGTTPGLTKTFGDQLLGSTGQGVQLGGLQNQLIQAIISGQLGKSSIPGNFQSGLGNLSSIFGLGGSLAGMFA